MDYVIVGELIMKLLDYTRKLTDKIKFYDSIAKNTFYTANPFAKPIAVTIVWVENDNIK